MEPKHRKTQPRRQVSHSGFAAILALCIVTGAPAASQAAARAARCDYASAPYTIRQLPWQPDQQSTKDYFSPNSRRMVFADGGQVKIFDIRAWKVAATLTPPMGARWPSWTSAGRIFFEGPSTSGGDNPLKPPPDPPPVYVMDQDGSSRVAVDTSALPQGDGSRGYRAGGNGYFKISPDGSRVAFNYGPNSVSTDPHNSFWFYVANVDYEPDGSVRFADPVRLSADTSYWSEAKAWSGDSSTIVFASTRGEEGDRRALNSDVYAMDLATGEITRMTHSPAWDEDGAILRGDLGPRDAVAFISDRDTPQPEQAQYGVSDHLPNDADWALVATAAVPLATWTSHEIFVAGPLGDRGWTRRLTFDYDTSGRSARAPVWSPDGTMIGFGQVAGTPESKAAAVASGASSPLDRSDHLLTFRCGGRS
jgi:Tol biopolymer transport system component